MHNEADEKEEERNNAHPEGKSLSALKERKSFGVVGCSGFSQEKQNSLLTD